MGLVPPNTLLGDRLKIEISGITMEIVWVPSEAPDEIAVWLPGLGVLQTAECVQGECYPNLYTLRGDVPRPAPQWVRSLDVLRTFPADALAKSHGRPVVGTKAPPPPTPTPLLPPPPFPPPPSPLPTLPPPPPLLTPSPSLLRATGMPPPGSAPSSTNRPARARSA